MAALINLARYVWAAPNSLIGLSLLPLVRLTGGHVQVKDGVLEMCGGLLDALLRRCVPVAGGASAMTLGHVVLARDRVTLDATRAHERVHVDQYERLGPLFLPAYLLASLWAVTSGRDAYHGNYFEEDATIRAKSGQTNESRSPMTTTR
jgi:hypothetical protein